MTADPTPHQQREFIQRMQQVGIVPLPHAYRWRDDRVAHRTTCTAVELPHSGEIRVFRYDYQLEFWLYAGSMELCSECKPGEFP